MAEIDTEYTQEAVCPWCGHEQSDSWELKDGEYECGECGESFVVERKADVTYCTHKAGQEGK